ncbi:MAG: PrsW family intramembrane metalloprotease [Candidatus Gracilibacteria bacterium]|nr:PrsW family intramembrane metalloprotease [Candidatus Gracilibacteria bacterium]
MNLLEAFSYVGHHPLEFIFCIILALIPSIVWAFIFCRKHKERAGVVLWTFFVGMLSAVIVLAYQYFWGTKFNLGFFSVEALNFAENIDSNFTNSILVSFLVFMSVGLMEEYLKHWVVKKADHDFFRSVDDVIELSIIAALGFAFLENVGYFFRQILTTGGEGVMGLFLIRSTLVVFIHILCSGIYGYFYGRGYFSKPIYEDEKLHGKKLYIPKIMHKLFHFKEEVVYHDEMTSLGLIVSVLLHGFYDFALDINMSLGEILSLSFLNNIELFHIIPPIILVFGFYALNQMLEDEEDQKEFGKKIIIEDYQ